MKVLSVGLNGDVKLPCESDLEKRLGGFWLTDKSALGCQIENFAQLLNQNF